MKILTRAGDIFQFLMVLIYLGAGILLLTGVIFKDNLSDPNRNGVGIILILYALYRGWKLYRHLSFRKIPMQDDHASN